MKLCVLLAGLLATGSASVLAQTYAPLSLSSLFSDHMVLQQNSKAPVWGWGNASSTVRLVGSWAIGDTVSTVVDASGKWKAELPTAKYGGPYRLQVFTGNDKIVLDDVMLGEVWLCSGQSNMEWTPGNGINRKEEEVQQARDSNIRFFSVPKRGAATAQDDCKADWELCTPEFMQKRSAVAYFFGKALRRELDVPVGLIISAWGGTPAEVWTPREVVEKDKMLSASLPLEACPWWPTEAGNLYNGMIHPLLPYRFAGAIWYQGESNAGHASAYHLLLEKMINSWRTAFGNAFPFYLVQIAPHTYQSKDNGPAFIREHQEWIAAHVENCGMVTVSDLVDDVRNIHPAEKARVGERLCRMALGKHYKLFDSGCETPVFDKMDVKNREAILVFRRVNKLVCKGKQVTGLQIAGSDGVYKPAKGTIKGDKLLVSSPEVKHPVAVRYCFDDAAIGNLFNEENWPIAPFRTDRGW